MIASKVFVGMFNELQHVIHETAKSKGWWDTDRSDGELIALIHSELSEMLEALRGGNKPYCEADPKHKDAKILERFSAVEVEAADVVIRLADMAAARGWNLGEAIIAKMAYNRLRSHRHGGKLF